MGWLAAIFDGKRMVRAASELGGSPDSLRASQESREDVYKRQREEAQGGGR